MKIDVAFFTIGGRGKTFSVDDDSELANLNKGDTVEINHRENNWNGIYEVIERDGFVKSITYRVLLKELELKHTNGGHNKRWIASTSDDGKKVTFKWGKIGGALQSMEKIFPSKQAAAEFIHEKIDEKLKKGYNQK
jgi:predicted DNA-binding WGR domain protein